MPQWTEILWDLEPKENCYQCNLLFGSNMLFVTGNILVENSHVAPKLDALIMLNTKKPNEFAASSWSSN